MLTISYNNLIDVMRSPLVGWKKPTIRDYPMMLGVMKNVVFPGWFPGV